MTVFARTLKGKYLHIFSCRSKKKNLEHMHIKELIPDIQFYYFLIKNKKHILKLTCSKRITYILKILNLILLCVEIFDLLFCAEPIEAL